MTHLTWCFSNTATGAFVLRRSRGTQASSSYRCRTTRSARSISPVAALRQCGRRPDYRHGHRSGAVRHRDGQPAQHQPLPVGLDHALGSRAPGIRHRPVDVRRQSGHRPEPQPARPAFTPPPACPRPAPPASAPWFPMPQVPSSPPSSPAAARPARRSTATAPTGAAADLRVRPEMVRALSFAGQGPHGAVWQD